MELNVKLRKEEGDLLADPSLYRKLVSSLVYLTIIKLDISFAVQQVNQFLQTPRHLHLVVVRRIIRMFKALLLLACSSLQAILLALLLIVMLIGQVVRIPVAPSLVGVCS